MADEPAIGVEVKATLEGDDVARELSALGLSGDGAQRQTIWFFDALDEDGELRLLTASIIVRLRQKKQGGKWTSTVKLRPAALDRLLDDFAPGSEAFGGDYKVEYDWSATPVLAASMDGKVKDDELAEVLTGAGDVGDLLSAEQHRLPREAGDPRPFRGLRPAGPVSALRWDDVTTRRLDDLRAEHWTYGREQRTFLELSLRAPDLEQAGEKRTLLLDDLADLGLSPDPDAPPKTETVLRDLLGA
ncbi:hypothetical protein [Actinomycetospora aeridis]|uniref:CYTH domain-containing protein n=1 Tax=Actinomycetospora aeridis TaxID=3129231 RepID=A0ABU8N5W3_9PSEU